ncbi:hypothetical protein EYR36_005296 [Pleurotus pulmonarius]|nr:hypothetical protein EYR36_005296 [Pleurotus pulmonarius]
MGQCNSTERLNKSFPSNLIPLRVKCNPQLIKRYPHSNHKLPTELIVVIISIVTDFADGSVAALQSMALVCHTWLHLCRHSLYRTLHVDSRRNSARIGMTCASFTRTFSEYSHLGSYVTNVSFNAEPYMWTGEVASCMMQFSCLRSLHLRCYMDEFDTRRGNLSAFGILLSHLLNMPTFTTLSLVGCTYASLHNTLLPALAETAQTTSLSSLSLKEIFPDVPTGASTPRSLLCMGRLRSLEVDDNGILEKLGIRTPSLHHFSTLYKEGALLPVQCPLQISSLSIQISHHVNFTAEFRRLPDLPQLRNLTLVSSWRAYNLDLPWIYESVQRLEVPKHLRRLRLQLCDAYSFRTLQPVPCRKLDDLLSRLCRDGFLEEVDLSLIVYKVEVLPSRDSIKACVEATWPMLMQTQILTISVAIAECDDYFLPYMWMFGDLYSLSCSCCVPLAHNSIYMRYLAYGAELASLYITRTLRVVTHTVERCPVSWWNAVSIKIQNV